MARLLVVNILGVAMSKISNRSCKIISDDDRDSDYEYNFDLNPFNYLLQGVHLLVALPFKTLAGLFKHVTDRLHRIQRDQRYRRTFKGPACMLPK